MKQFLKKVNWRMLFLIISLISLGVIIGASIQAIAEGTMVSSDLMIGCLGVEMFSKTSDEVLASLGL